MQDYNWNDLIAESKEYDQDNIAVIITVLEELEQIVEALPKAAYVSAMRKASDPEGDSNIDIDKLVARAKKHHGDKFANDLDSGARKMHYPRNGHTYGHDKLADRKSPRSTASGKANKQDLAALKTKIKRGY